MNDATTSLLTEHFTYTPLVSSCVESLATLTRCTDRFLQDKPADPV